MVTVLPKISVKFEFFSIFSLVRQTYRVHMVQQPQVVPKVSKWAPDHIPEGTGAYDSLNWSYRGTKKIRPSKNLFGQLK